MHGEYIGMQVSGRIVGPIVAFREYIFRDVLPAFGNIDDRANQVADDYFNRVGSMPASEYQSFDMSDVADDAQAHSLDWWEMMTSLRQTMLNLLAAGLFHLVEQQLAALSRDNAVSETPVTSTKLWDVADWYLKTLRLDLKKLNSWPKIDELRLVANAVKHGQHREKEKLRDLRPELFLNPMYAQLYEEDARYKREQIGKQVIAPLSGEEFFVTEEFLKGYAEAAETFFVEIAAYFKANAATYF
jgi:hypothetical protein